MINLPDGQAFDINDLLIDIRADSAIDLYNFSHPHHPMLLSDGVSTQKCRDFIPQSKRFVVDEAATKWLADMVLQNHELVDELRPFAIIPYSKMSIEAAEMKLPAPIGLTGVLVIFATGRKFNIAFLDTQHGRFLTMPELQDNPLLCDFSRLFGLALFLAFTGRRVQTVQAVEGRRTLSRRKVRYFSKSKITIDILSPRKLRQMVKHPGTHATPRRHEVMGHFVHRSGLPHGCSHEWVKVDRGDDIPRWECGNCGRKRTWRKAFERGDAGKGFVRQQYEVTA